LNLAFYLFFGFIALLFVVFVWSVGKPRRSGLPLTIENLLKGCEERHTAYMPQIRQALSEVDGRYLKEHCSQATQRRVRKERDRISAAFLGALKNDFDNLLSLAQLIAKLSPQIAAIHEWERLRLTATFRLQFGLIRFQLRAGRMPLDQISRLSMVVSGLSMRVEGAIQELGERAAMAAELGSAVNRRRANFAE